MSSEYPDNFVDRLELLWGPGFLSAGGPAEVGEILAGVDVSGKSVLDIGCGTGGPAIVLARDLGAATVTGIDLAAMRQLHFTYARLNVLSSSWAWAVPAPLAGAPR